MKKLKEIIESIKFKWLRETSLTVLIIAIIVAIFFAINIGIKALNIADIDFTSNKIFSLTEESKNQIANLPKEDKIEIYMFDYNENESITDLVKQYERINENITVEVLKVSDRLDLATQYDIKENNYDILIKSGEKYKIIKYEDLYTIDYSTYEQIDLTEQRITNGIISVSSEGGTIPIYMLAGHGEYAVSSALASLKTYAELENYELKELNLLVTQQVPEDCKALIISSPSQDMTDFERDKIIEYINKGGNILWMNDVLSATTSLKNFDKILELYGTKLEQNGIILEQDPNKVVMGAPDLILPTIESNELTEELAQNGIVILLDSGKLSFDDAEKLEELGIVKTDILSTSEKALYRTDLSSGTVSQIDSDELGKQVLGAVLEKTIDENNTSKLVIYANNAFATDMLISVNAESYSAVQLYNNMDLVLNSIAYVADTEDRIVIRKNIDTTMYTATETQDTIVRILVFGIPIVIIVLGIVVWQLRRRKK